MAAKIGKIVQSDPGVAADLENALEDAPEVELIANESIKPEKMLHSMTN